MLHSISVTTEKSYTAPSADQQVPCDLSAVSGPVLVGVGLGVRRLLLLLRFRPAVGGFGRGRGGAGAGSLGASRLSGCRGVGAFVFSGGGGAGLVLLLRCGGVVRPAPGAFSPPNDLVRERWVGPGGVRG